MNMFCAFTDRGTDLKLGLREPVFFMPMFSEQI